MKIGAKKWILLHPRLVHDKRSIELYIEHAQMLIAAQKDQDDQDQQLAIENALQITLLASDSLPPKEKLRITAAVNALTDLSYQGWAVRIANDEVEVSMPEQLLSNPPAEKARIRHQELQKRNEQLSSPSVRKFIKDMERKRLHGQHFVSIFSLMRDGRTLADALRNIRRIPSSDRVNKLKEIIDPYLQFVSNGVRCDYTGLFLRDIWRYFRHTWTNQYTSIPGRNLMFLVRDRASINHPIVGIGALASPIIQIEERDTWIGWHPKKFLDDLRKNPSPKILRWLSTILKQAYKELYVDDLLEEQIVSAKELRCPESSTVSTLLQYSAEQRKLHNRYVRSQELKRSRVASDVDNPASYWVARARTHLFKSKRALSLAELLSAQMILDQYLDSPPTIANITALLANREGKRAIATIIRKAKADRIGIAMADITVCGAVPPYNPILGGKLIAMLAVSPEVVKCYNRRYKTAESVIASSMAGRSIVRPSDLVFLGTTSLYGVGSSQYNRVTIPANRLGGEENDQIQYLSLGRSHAFGTSHFSDATVKKFIELIQKSKNGQRITSIFGEGVSPKLRKIREGLDELGFPSDSLLQHGRSRIVYGVNLVKNLREYLLGMDKKPEYKFSMWGQGTTKAITQWWQERWLSRRIELDHVLDEMQQHSLTRPIQHGARVTLPPIEKEQFTLFEDL